jgi:hypothetical protein
MQLAYLTKKTKNEIMKKLISLCDRSDVVWVMIRHHSRSQNFFSSKVFKEASQIACETIYYFTSIKGNSLILLPPVLCHNQTTEQVEIHLLYDLVLD